MKTLFHYYPFDNTNRCIEFVASISGLLIKQRVFNKQDNKVTRCILLIVLLKFLEKKDNTNINFHVKHCNDRLRRRRDKGVPAWTTKIEFVIVTGSQVDLGTLLVLKLEAKQISYRGNFSHIDDTRCSCDTFRFFICIHSNS